MCLASCSVFFSENIGFYQVLPFQTKEKAQERNTVFV
ncbi:hypothetical protein CLS_15240 [[Clostridium] cf. saccharolyticum K10]|nr:hypothetical protein CLS_15240 [[Clostridium] cf. saccharolyticum K10]